MSSRPLAYLLLAPATLLIGCVFLVPFILLLVMGFWTQKPGSLLLDTQFTLINYQRIFGDNLYLRGLLTTLWLSAATTLICLAIALPVAYFMVKKAGRARGLLMALMLIPLVSGALLPTLGLVNLLSTLGVVNGALKALGLIDKSISFLGNSTGILIGLVQSFLPLAVLPLVTVLDRLPADYEDAAMSLGASRRNVWRRVLLPLSMPGLLAGGLLVFCAALTSFVTPQILGQGKVATFATMAFQQASLVLDWPFASALAVVMLAILALIALAASLAQKRMAHRRAVA
ncbi:MULTISPECIES: ABC transporter permease [Rhizobium]|uniref:ABC transporter permease n=1 Tax=unclassified Rhizobium TaxID=2613769 RepID=UPI001ADBD4D9|nr:MULTISPECIES: ABC transporter permease [unclassified Rhizobium]MBO9101191.1 ABC transporter permease [Rhizobium sp. L58/93]MBO9170840.1 ABC transporter permease [Rhizobium sp. L245/93]MBO9186757.1 ABC transporter permease [Rhizobium sp. E27B/91]QXZ86212.1 ABC transporter permease [Rhizobium sp. K1/93]QXZ92332.1 ABC transporter permease [Rhizobium sp. K15/93]